MEILSLGGWLEVWPCSLSSFIMNLDLGNLLLWTSTTTFVKGEAWYIFLLQRTLSSPELKMLLLNVVFWCCWEKLNMWCQMCISKAQSGRR